MFGFPFDCRLTDHATAIRQYADNRGQEIGACVCIRDNAGRPLVNIRNQAIGGSQVDPNYTFHDTSFSFSTSRKRVRR